MMPAEQQHEPEAEPQNPGLPYPVPPTTSSDEVAVDVDLLETSPNNAPDVEQVGALQHVFFLFSYKQFPL